MNFLCFFLCVKTKKEDLLLTNYIIKYFIPRNFDKKYASPLSYRAVAQERPSEKWREEMGEHERETENEVRYE